MRKYLSLTTAGSFEKLIDALEDYRIELREKTEEFVNRLLEVGIETASENTGEYGGMILFRREISPTIDGCDGLLIATDGRKIVRTWYASKRDAELKRKARSYEVSPLLLAEFGSGWLASVLDNVEGVGQGTMPNSYGHAFEDHWAWYDENANKQVSSGETPTFPMHSAMIAMLFEVDSIGKEVFGDGK